MAPLKRIAPRPARLQMGQHEVFASAVGGAAPIAVERDIRFPRIDGPQTPAIRRFNELVAQQPQFSLGDATNENVDYSIAYAGEELISVKFVVSADSIAAANATNTVKAVTVVMSDGGRLLTEGDVFRVDSGWQNFITDRAVARISREFPDYANFPPRRDVYETATKPHLWLITERGPVLMFPPLSFGGSHADDRGRARRRPQVRCPRRARRGVGRRSG